MQSSPDAIGLISWNEFSENSYIELSEKYSHRYLDVLANIRNAPAPAVPDFDSSEPSSVLDSIGTDQVAAFILLGLLVIFSLFILVRRITH